MNPLHALARRLWPLLDWRRHAVLEARGRRGAAAMLDESMRRTVATLRWEPEGEERFIPLTDEGRRRSSQILAEANRLHGTYRLGDSDGTRVHEPENIARDVDTSPVPPTARRVDAITPWDDEEPADGEAVPPPTTRTVDRQTLLRRAREASQGGADYLPPWTGEGL